MTKKNKTIFLFLEGLKRGDFGELNGHGNGYKNGKKRKEKAIRCLHTRVLGTVDLIAASRARNNKFETCGKETEIKFFIYMIVGPIFTFPKLSVKQLFFHCFNQRVHL